MTKVINFIKAIRLPIIAIVMLIAFVIFSRECRRDVLCPPNGMVLVDEGFIDSLEKVALMAPDTLYDTLYLKGDIIYVPGEVPEPIIIDADTKVYKDSIVNDSVSVWASVTVKGEILEWDWRYRPIIKETTITIEKPIPIPVPYKVVYSRTEMYGSVLVGGNQTAFILSGQLDLITKNNNIYGLQYMRFGNDNFYLFKLGTKIKLRR